MLSKQFMWPMACLVCVANPVRLVSMDGERTANLSAGRFQIFINNTWGTVCDVSDSNSVLSTACRQLGYSRAVGSATASELQ